MNIPYDPLYASGGAVLLLFLQHRVFVSERVRIYFFYGKFFLRGEMIKKCFLREKFSGGGMIVFQKKRSIVQDLKFRARPDSVRKRMDERQDSLRGKDPGSTKLTGRRQEKC